MNRGHKFRKIVKQFKKDLYKIMTPALAIAIKMTYAAYKHRKHIHAIWGLSINYPDFKKAYNNELFGKHLCGDETFFNMIYFIEKTIWDKYYREVPPLLALGKAWGMALNFLRKNK